MYVVSIKQCALGLNANLNFEASCHTVLTATKYFVMEFQKVYIQKCNEYDWLHQAVVTRKFQNTMHSRRAHWQVSGVLTTLGSPLPIYEKFSSD